MRIISFCCDGIRQAAQQGMYPWLLEQDADIICLQNIRALEYQLDHDVFHPPGYEAYFFDSGENHYSGVALYTRELPKAIIRGFGFANGLDMHGRYIQADFEHLSVGSLLIPSGRTKKQPLQDKFVFLEDLANHLDKISHKRRNYVFCGNFELAHLPDDVAHCERHENKTVGFLAEEQQWMDQVLDQLGYEDAFRAVDDDYNAFTWWPNPDDDTDAWRMDYQLVSGGLRPQIKSAVIHSANRFGSTHAPLVIDYDTDY